MDSTTPDPKPQPQQQNQQQHHQQQATQQQYPQHQQHQQQQPTQPNNHKTQQSHQQHAAPQPAQQPPYQPMPPPPTYHNTYYPYPQQYSYTAAYTAYPPYPQPWPRQSANFNPASAQPISNMVTPQPHPNVPQQHTKPPTQIMNQVINTDNRTHNQSPMQTVPNQTVTKSRERKPAVLKDPTTNKEVPLPNTTPSSTTSSSPSIAKTTTNATTTTNTTTSVEHVHTLLQKVSEDNTSEATTKEVPQTNTSQSSKINLSSPSIAKATTNSAKVAQTNVAKTSTDKENISLNVVKEVTSNATRATTNTAIANNTTSSKEHVHTILNKVSEDNGNEAADKKALPSNTAPSPTVKTSPIAAASENKASTISSATSEDHVQAPQEKSSVDNGDDTTTTNEQLKEETPSKSCPVDDNSKSGDGDDSTKEDEEQESDKEEAQLKYESWQYNPVLNREGKKVYSKQFMLDVAEKICKLEYSKLFEAPSHAEKAFSEQVDLFNPKWNNIHTPNNRSNEPQRRQQYTGRSSAGPERPRKVIAPVSVSQDVELKQASNPWRPTKDIKDDAPTDIVETESLKKKFRSILNKLTPNNFENLAIAVTDLNIDTESKLGEVIDIVFAKALAEPGYCVLYGQMCSHLKKITAGQANFGNTLLKRCQHQFQSDIYSGLNLDERKEKIEKEEDPEVKKQLNEELYEDMYRSRMKGLGLIKFIGELYKIQMLNDKIMFECVVRLLNDPSEESLECLCDLLATIGEKLDRSSQESAEKEKKTPKGSFKTNAYQGGQKSAAAVVASGTSASQQKAAEQDKLTTLDQVFEQLHKIRKNKSLDLSVRIRFKLLDTCDLREKDNWQSKNTKDNNPKKIEEIREAHKEKLEQERRQQNAMGPRRGQEGRRGLGHSSGSSSQISSLANESSGNRGSSNMHTSSSSHIIRDLSIGDNVKSNHNDIETHNRHKKLLEGLKGTFLNNKISLSTEPLRPNSQLGLRPMTGGGGGSGGGGGNSSGSSLRPLSFSANAAAAAAANVAKSAASTAAPNNPTSSTASARIGAAPSSDPNSNIVNKENEAIKD